jgi:hypothetical protein
MTAFDRRRFGGLRLSIVLTANPTCTRKRKLVSGVVAPNAERQGSERDLLPAGGDHALQVAVLQLESGAAARDLPLLPRELIGHHALRSPGHAGAS